MPKDGAKNIRVKRGLKIKIVDFKKRSKIDDDFRGSVGVYDPELQIAYVDKTLPIIAKGTRELCQEHEAVHHRLRNLESKKILLGGLKKNELYVDLEALTRTSGKHLSYAEEALKKYLTNFGKASPNFILVE